LKPTDGGERAHRPLRLEPLWVRVDRNRLRFIVFLVTFVIGAAVLLTAAFVAVPGSLIGLVADADGYYVKLGYVVGAVFVLGLGAGGVAAGVQVSNAEHWVRGRFSGTDLDSVAHPALVEAVTDMSIAAGLPQPPALLLFAVPSVNACAIGASRKRPFIGVTQGFIDGLTSDEQRAVVATLIARISRGDILVGTGLAALMGPLKQIRHLRQTSKSGEAPVADGGSDGCDPGCTSGCSDLDGCGDLGDGDGCGGAIAVVLFAVLVAIITWVAVLFAAWLVTAWGRALQRTGHEKADAEGMLLLRDPQPMLSALRKAISSSNEIADGDPSYDGIFYASTSGKPAIEKVERRRYDRLREVLGVDGLAATELGFPTLRKAPAGQTDGVSTGGSAPMSPSGGPSDTAAGPGPADTSGSAEGDQV
jgi:Zn-dependent protease with chaperone function